MEPKRFDGAFDPRLTMERRAHIVLNGVMDANQLRADRAAWAHARNRRIECDWQTKVDRLLNLELRVAARKMGCSNFIDEMIGKMKFASPDLALKMPQVSV